MKKSYWSVLEKLAFKAKVDDGRTDDGQVGIGKAPLPYGTAELKIQGYIHYKNKFAKPFLESSIIFPLPPVYVNSATGKLIANNYNSI